MKNTLMKTLLLAAALFVFTACSEGEKQVTDDAKSAQAGVVQDADSEAKLAEQTTSRAANLGHAAGKFPEVDIATVPYTEPVNVDEKGIIEHKIVLNNGIMTPDVLVIEKGKKVRLLLENQGSVPAEFESRSLRQEKVLYMGSKSSLIIMPLDEGKYDIFDDFTPGHPGWIVAK